ncbi:hypothetical protein [Actinomadura keratinilytica]|uniref:hypothetical protein n=1 Tax=Actinomadura keratinilytica TaxID=547461 RepID=UPI0036105B5F
MSVARPSPSTTVLRRDDRSALLRALYFSGPRSRQELAEATGLSQASVGNVTRELIRDGIVAEIGSVDSEVGRPRVPLQVNPEHGYVVGVDVGRPGCRSSCSTWR